MTDLLRKYKGPNNVQSMYKNCVYIAGDAGISLQGGTLGGGDTKIIAKIKFQLNLIQNGSGCFNSIRIAVKSLTIAVDVEKWLPIASKQLPKLPLRTQ